MGQLCINKWDGSLPLAGLDSIGVDVGILEMGKPELTWTGIVGVGAGEEDRQP